MRNGVDSIMQDRKECYITGATTGLHKHHLYAGSRRHTSDENGFWIWLRYDWHNGANYAVHFNHDLDLQLKQACQEKYEETHSREEFRKLIGKSYL